VRLGEIEKDGADVGHVAHVEHAINFIKNEHFDARQVDDS